MKMTVSRIVATALLLTAVSAATADLTAAVSAIERGDYATALHELRLLAEQGDAKAQFNLGVMYAKGGGVPQNDRQAVFWWRKAAEQGLVEAQYNLGLMYANGKGVPQNDRQAVFWWRKAAEQGYAEAQYNLGVNYDRGKGVPQNDRQAVFWYHKAAEQGLAGAQYNLGVMYDNGEGVPQNDRQAVFWWRKAAEQGDAKAQFNLGVMYDKGEGVPQNDRQAVFWYRKAAEQGLAKAQFNLGVRYAKGEGVPKDFVQAYAWYNLAAAQGGEKAKQYLDLLLKLMTSAQIAEAQQISRKLEARISNRGESPSSLISDGSVRSPAPSRKTVLEAQKLLASLGYDPGPADGWAGQRTKAAVRQFQRDLGITPTGRISEELLALLAVAAAVRQKN